MFDIVEYLNKYIDNYPFVECIVASGCAKQYIMDLKTGKKEITREDAEALIKTFEHKEAEFKPKNEAPKAYIDKSLQRIAFNFCKTSVIFNPYNE